jgi:hypothetical protein
MTMVFGYRTRTGRRSSTSRSARTTTSSRAAPIADSPHFYPRRSPFLFTIKVPKDFGDKEIVWTLKTHGKVERPTRRSRTTA